MAQLATPHELGVAICRALGLDPNRVAALALRIRPGHVVTCAALMHVDQDGGDRLVKELRRFELVTRPCTDGKAA